jgi:hypothetical protein
MMPPWIDFDQEQRRAERLSDLSRSAFVIGTLALSIVGGFAIMLLWPFSG